MQMPARSGEFAAAKGRGKEAPTCPGRERAAGSNATGENAAHKLLGVLRNDAPIMGLSGKQSDQHNQGEQRIRHGISPLA